MKVRLIFPPHAQPFVPHPALPALSACLQREGCEVRQSDLNLAAFEHFLSPSVLEGFGMDPAAARDVAVRKQDLRSGSEVLDPPIYYRAVASLRNALAHVSRAHGMLQWDLKSLDFGAWSPACWSDIRNAASDEAVNAFIPFFAARVDEMAGEDPDLVGISVAWRQQVIPAFTLARLVRERMPRAHIVMGGSMITHLAEVLAQQPEAFAWVDGFLPFEGEIALAALVRALPTGSLAEVPGMLRRDGDRVVAGPPATLPHLRGLPVPDYGGLPLSSYYSPRIYLPVSASRGCYWARCAFCSHHYSGSRYRPRPAHEVVAEMDALHARHGCLDFYFSDDALPPALAARVARLIAEGGRPYRWVAELRLERQMNRAYFEGLYAGGCRVALFGMESCRQRVLDLMRKGTRESDLAAVIRAASDAGIITWAFFFLGFPGETPAEARATLDFLVANRAAIDMVAGGPFVLTRNAPVFEAREQVGIERIDDDERLDLQISFHHRMRADLRWDPALLLRHFRSRPETTKFLEPFVAEPHMLYFPKAYFQEKGRA